MEDIFSLKGKNAVVLGGAGGLGEAIVEGLSQYGATLIIASRKLETLEKVAADVTSKTGNVVIPMQVDVTDPQAGDMIRDALGGAAVDVVLSDMAASSTGHRQTDHLRVIALAEAALDIAEDVLKLGGAYLAKVLQGGASGDLLTRLRRGFTKVSHVKPKASRQDSAEVYVLATGFRGASQAKAPK